MIRSQKKTDCENALSSLFNASVRVSVALAIRKICADGDVHNLIRKSRSIIEQMSDKTEDEKLIVQDCQAGLSRTLILCIFYYLDNQGTSSFSCASKVLEDFNDLKMSTKGRQLCEQCRDCTDPAFPWSTKKSKPGTTKPHTLAGSFRKWVKRELAILHQSKDQLHQDYWYRNMQATARAQNVEKVLDMCCMARNEDIIEFINNQIKLMHSFFERLLLIDQEKEIFRHYETYHYVKEYKCHTNYIKASLDNLSQLSCLTITIIDEWKGADKSFILYWQR